MTDIDTAAIRAQMPDLGAGSAAIFVDQDGDVCIADGRDYNLVFCPAASDVHPFGQLCPDIITEIIRRHNAAPDMHATILALCDALDGARAENERLRAALAFYATPENWCIDGPLDGNSPRYTGGPSRAALAEGEA